MKLIYSSIAPNRAPAFFTTDSHPSQRFHRAKFCRTGFPCIGGCHFKTRFTQCSSGKLATYLANFQCRFKPASTNRDGQDYSSTAHIAHSNDVGLHGTAHPTEYHIEGPQFVGQASETPPPIGANLKCALPGGPLQSMPWVKFGEMIPSKYFKRSDIKTRRSQSARRFA